MTFYALDPLEDSRWDDLVASHPRASVFHHSGWLRALARTYGYRTVALTSTPPGRPLTDGLVYCEVKSWVTGNRLVSLPFSDHADILLSEDVESSEFENWVTSASLLSRWKYIEFRPVRWKPHRESQLAASQHFSLHILSLAPSCEQLFANLHKDCMQRRVRHAEREYLTYERGSSEDLLSEFYRLLLITRRRHLLLPQPRAWFSNLLSTMGRSLEIRLARKNGIPIAAILTLRHDKTVVYKYGCSDQRFHHLGAMPFLFWNLIEECKFEGADQVDLGRTAVENRGLTKFKDHLGANRTPLVYLRYPPRRPGQRAYHVPSVAPRVLFSILPDALFSKMGGMIYRHVG